MATRKKSSQKATTKKLFREDQSELFEKSLEQEIDEERLTAVECLGLRFENDEARRKHFTDELRKKLKDPEFRKTPGFPKGSDDDILRMSDPPWYTACPNPFLADFVRCYGRPYDPKEPYHREPFAVDTSVGKTDRLYKAHGYHTKVPHLAIVPSILHYTKPGDIVLDGFCGSGMTGVAAQWCGSAPAEFRKKLEMEWKDAGLPKPEWGARRAIVADLSPAATFIAANYNLPFDARRFSKEARRVLAEVEAEVGWMYETLGADGKARGRINFTVWSEVFACPNCSRDVVFVDAALDLVSKRVRETFLCSNCGAELTKNSLVRSFETLIDPVTGQPYKRIKLRPVLIDYTVGRQSFQKRLDSADRAVLDRAGAMPIELNLPSTPFDLDAMYHGSRLGPKGFTSIHHLFSARALAALGALWKKSDRCSDPRVARGLRATAHHQLVNASFMNRYRPASSFGNAPLGGVYYVSSMIAEASVIALIKGTIGRLERMAEPAWVSFRNLNAMPAISTQSTSRYLGVPENSVDYLFTDPPFGENIFYADLNFFEESWHRVFTDSRQEAIVDQAKRKSLSDYQEMMRRCFAEYFRVLKPGRWMTVVFSNSSNAVWRTIQEAIGMAGFMVADVRTLDKQQGSFRQVTSSAVKQDLVISAYKPSEALTRKFSLGQSSSEAVWAFISEHLAHLPVFVGEKGAGEVIVERTPQMLHDRMVAAHVLRGLAIPLSTAEFLEGIESRCISRDGMVFLSTQAAEYDRKRSMVSSMTENYELFVVDERSAINWVRRELSRVPRSFQVLQPEFMQQLQAWRPHEISIELRALLDQNFLCYQGDGPVPSQIHSYLSTNFKPLRNLGKSDPKLVEEATGRWYVPDPGKQGDIDKLRVRALLKEFETYRDPKQKKLKQFRTEAVRVGFHAANERKDYAVILEVAKKLPESVVVDDEQISMYVDVARIRSEG